jgi:ribosome-binding factor A
MKGNRLTRVADLLRHEVAEILTSRMRDPRLGFVTVTGVEVAPDLRNATVFVSVLGPGESFAEHVKLLNHAAPFIWRELAHRHLDLRHLPQLRFRADHSLEHAQRIQELLREAGPIGEAEPDAPGETPDDDPPSGDEPR